MEAAGAGAGDDVVSCAVVAGGSDVDGGVTTFGAVLAASSLLGVWCGDGDCLFSVALV